MGQSGTTHSPWHMIYDVMVAVIMTWTCVIKRVVTATVDFKKLTKYYNYDELLI